MRVIICRIHMNTLRLIDFHFLTTHRVRINTHTHTHKCELIACLLTILMILSIKQYFLDIFKLICSIKRKWERIRWEKEREYEHENARELIACSGSHSHLLHTSVAHNFQHITHFEVYTSMFKSKGPCKNYHHTHIYLKSGYS